MIYRVVYSLFFISLFCSSIAQSPSIGGYHVYYGTLHNHTTVSDGTGTEDDAYNYARNVAGLDYFSTANHVGSIDEAEWASIKAASDKYNEDGVFTAFWGFEFTELSTNGDITVINSDKTSAMSDPSPGTFVELCAWLDASNGLAFFNHPGRGGNFQFERFATTPTDKIVGMELFNKTLGFDVYYYNDGFYPNDGNLNHFAEANSRGWRIGASGADDNHGGTWGTQTDFRMAILSEHLTRADLFEAMQERRFYSTLDKNLALSFKMGGAEMGSVLEGAPYDIQILANDGDEESFTKVMLFRNGLEFNTWEIDTPNVDLSLSMNTFDGEFFYIKVTQADGDEAVSSPIFIKGGLFNVPPVCNLTSPLDGTHFEIPQSVTITADASDEDGSVASVEFFADGNSLGLDTEAPYSIDFTIPANGAYEITVKVTDNNEYWVISDLITFTVGEFSITVSSRIADGMDDVEEISGGTVYTNSSDIELVYDDSNQIIGLRFTGMNIPPGAAIESASIQFTVDEESTGACVLSIKGENADDSPSFTSASNNVSNRVTTTAEVTWEPAEWPTVGAAGADQETPDLSAIIQEIVNRPGYTQSSAITIIIAGSGERTAEAYEGDAGSAALLTVHYSSGMQSTGVTAGIDETRVRIFPNPVSEGMITLQVSGPTPGVTSVSIFDLTGRICCSLQIEKEKAYIDVSGFKPGLYIINVSDRNRSYSHKLIVK